jgi:thioredoxin 1
MRAQLAVWVAVLAIAGCETKPQPAATGTLSDAKVVTLTAEMLVDFYADWCGPCKRMKPVVEELAREFAGHAKVASLDVDAHPEVAAAFRIDSLPAFILFRDGRPIEQVVGAVPKNVLERKLYGLVDGRMASKQRPVASTRDSRI